MVGPIRFDGLFSGIDFQTIIKKLLSIEQRPIVQLKSRIEKATDRKNALLEVNTSLLALKGTADALARPSFWAATKVSSTNDSILGASGNFVSSLGAFTFAVRKLAQSHQMISNGFPDSTTTPVTTSAATLTFEIGGGRLDRRTPVSFLNSQTGFDRGAIKITDSAGRVGIVNLEGAVTVQDVLDELNNATSVTVRATVAGDRLVIQDKAGGAGPLTIENYGADTTASSLGIAGTSVLVGPDKFVFGTDVNTIDASTRLSLLNDGLGVRRNIDGASDFTITGTTGGPIAVDLQGADDTLGEVLSRINSAATAAGSSLTASLAPGGNALVLTDTFTGAGAISITPAANSLAAVDLGLGALVGAAFTQNGPEISSTGVQDLVNGNRVVGNSLTPGLNSTLRSLLNGGQTNLLGADPKGVSDGSITITDRQGDMVTLNASSRVQTTTTAGAGAGATSLSLGSVDGFAVGNRMRVQTSSGIEYRTVTSISGLTVSFDRSLAGAVGAGDGVVALNDSVEDIVRLVNDRATAAGVNVRVEANTEGNGLRVVDLTGATAFSLTVAGAPAVDLGIAGVASGAVLNGADVDAQYVGETTALAALNGGSGVSPGKIRFIDTDTTVFDVDLTQSDDTTIGEVIKEINASASAAGSGLVARINDTGDGILLTDAAPGAGVLQVQELNGGRTARDLNIVGAAPGATPTAIDGSFEYSVAIQANSNLQDVATAINARALGVSAAVISDGSAINPYKITLTSTRAGETGRLTVDGTISGLSFSTTAAAQDAVLVYGSNGGAMDPAVITSSSNTITRVVPGLTLQLKGTSSAPVTITTSRDHEAIVQQAQRFVDNYNEAVKKIREFTFFNPDGFDTGVLFNDSTIRRVRRDLAGLVVNAVPQISSGDPNSLASVGMKVTGEGALTFDSGRFSSLLDGSFDKVQTLFTLQRRLTIGTLSKDLNSGRGVTNVGGADFTVRARNATTRFEVDISGAETVGSILQKINTAPGNGGVIQALISSDGFSIELVDNSAILTRGVDAVISPTAFVEGDADLDALATGDLVGATLTFLSGGNNGEVRKVTAFDTATNEITFDSALPFAMLAGDSYKIERELEVVNKGVGTAASELKIARKLALGQTLLRGDLLNLNSDPGIGFWIGERLDYMTRRGDGLISTRTDSLDDSIKGYTESIEKIGARLQKLEERLIRQFARLETAIAESQGTMQRLQSSMAGLFSMMGGVKK